MKKMFLLFAGILLFNNAYAQEGVVGGKYTVDKHHASLTFSLNHLGVSLYTAGFDEFDATLYLDPNDLTKSSVEARINPNSLDIPSPPDGFIDELLGNDWLNIGAFPDITFVSNKVELIDAKNALIYGDFYLHGIKKPLVLEAVFIGASAAHPMDPNPRVGFSAKGKFKRSDYGITIGIPAPGTTMGVGDEITVVIEAEFTGQ